MYLYVCVHTEKNKEHFENIIKKISFLKKESSSLSKKILS